MYNYRYTYKPHTHIYIYFCTFHVWRDPQTMNANVSRAQAPAQERVGPGGLHPSGGLPAQAAPQGAQCLGERGDTIGVSYNIILYYIILYYIYTYNVNI